MSRVHDEGHEEHEEKIFNNKSAALLKQPPEKLYGG